MLVALVAVVFHERIFAEFGAGDSAALRACVTSRELLALTVIALPALAAVLFLLAPTGLVTALARFASVPVAALAFALTVLALRASGEPVVGDWLVVDAPADCSSA